MNVLHQDVDEFGDVTGAYGLAADIRRGYRRVKPMIRRGLQNLVKSGLKTAVNTFVPGAGAVLEPRDRPVLGPCSGRHWRCHGWVQRKSEASYHAWRELSQRRVRTNLK